MSPMTQYQPEPSLEKGIERLRAQVDGKVAAYFSSCVNCGLCAEACHFYVETRDPRYTPIHKVAPFRKLWRQEYTFFGKLAGKLGLSSPVSESDFAEWEDLVYDSCTLCGRCTMVCPSGIDITALIRKQREGFSAAGYAPDGLKSATKRTIETGSPMGVSWKSLRAQIKHVEKETSLTVPVDQKGVEYLALLSSLEIMGFPEYIGALTRILHHAGISWTLSSEAFEATNSGIQIGDAEVASELLQRIFTVAHKLEVRNIISPECGHAYTAIRWESANLLGKEIPFRVVHIVELMDELKSQGRLSTVGKTERHLTFHDPCNLVRKGGVVDEPRRLLNSVASNFVEHKDTGVMNWCCGGGGGVSAIEHAQPLRIAAFRRKKQQLEDLQVNTLVTACANCRNILEEGIEHCGMDVEVIGLTELIAEHLEKPAETSRD
ncbi:MAG: Fe-S oxidoreductase [Parasphingorhabdus sp.]|jgi:Fe-S oxidoreductase